MSEAARERTVRANGLDHHVIEWGPADGTPVLFCHGFLDLGFGFVTLGPALAAAGFRAVAFDFRGHGETGWVSRDGYYHFADYVRDVHELAPQLFPGPFHLVGHSMGGTVSALYAATHPERVQRLVLMEGLGPPSEDVSLAPARMKTWLSGVDDVLAEQEPLKLRDLAHATSRLAARNPTVAPALLAFLAAKATRPHPSGEGLCWRFDPLHRTRSPAGFDARRFGHFLREIRQPTLLVLGEKGMRTGEEEARAAELCDARSETIADATHMMHWTHPSETASLVLAHLT